MGFRAHATVRRILGCAGCALALCSASACAQQARTPRIALELIMSDPDWIGNAPQRAYWADDSRSIYYSKKRPNEEHHDLVQIDLEGNVLRIVSDDERGTMDVPRGQWSRDRNRKVYVLHGDLFVKDLVSGEIRQLARTHDRERRPRFVLNDTAISFQRGTQVFVRDLNAGLEFQPADLRAEKDPEDKKKDEKYDYLKGQQVRLFDHVREQEKKREFRKQRDRAQHDADQTRVPRPWYLGEDVEIVEQNLSPTCKWMIVRLRPKKSDAGKKDTMPNYVSESGYVTSRNVRSKVGTGKPTGDTLLLLDLGAKKRYTLDPSEFPGIADDPLKELRDAARAERKSEKTGQPVESENAKTDDHDKPSPPEALDAMSNEDSDDKGADAKISMGDADKKDKEKSPKSRPIRFHGITWNEDGNRVLLQLFSLDRKDRWIATIDLDSGKFVPQERITDPAWINWRFSTAAWLKDGETIYFLSEESGYSALYLKNVTTGRRRLLVGGEFEVSSVERSHAGDQLYYTANTTHPGVYERHRVNVTTGGVEQLTHLGGRNRVRLSPDERHLLVTHSATTRPEELHVQPNEAGAQARRITNTISEQFASIPWAEPQVIPIPSRKGQPIYSRIYAPKAGSAESENSLGSIHTRRPAVVFIHGAGYLQNAHFGWSHYFREFMFHSLLVERGYVVLDMDYRASAGYGRDWRTAIYRNMGTHELEDLEDGVAWLAEHRNVDPARVGVYGGSYGGFLTLMALFTKPDLFACGAALRPVTDWAHYNHGYTSAILNTPPVDPDAYERSSPIEFADGLNKPLLICHGMQDDNVFFQDSVRLAQRLIELKKENWQVAMYPIEPHGFREPTSWLDEYRRILRLFETHLK